VLQISPASTSPNVTLNEQGKTKAFVFRASFVDPFQGVVLANFARQQGLQQAYVIYDQSNPNSSGLAQYFLATFQKGGGRIAGQEPYTLETTDFGPILDRVAASQAQVLLIPDMGQRVNVIAQQARQKGLKAILMGGDGWEASDLDLAAVEGSYYTTAYSTLDPNARTQAWAARYRTRYNRDPNALAALGYDAANLLFTAIQQAGTDDPAKVKDVLAGLKFEGVTGQFSFDAQHNPVKSAIVMQIKNGQRVYAGTVEP
jgi:branched-chain amino acid transport system substrate-binding protein